MIRPFHPKSQALNILWEPSFSAGLEAAKSWPSFAPTPALKVQGLDPWLTASGHVAFAQASFPVAEISAASSFLANVHMNPDSDGVYRRAALFEVFDSKICRRWPWRVF